VRRELHRSYIRNGLETFSENKGVIHLTSAEYTGPLHFVRFWLEVIGEWEKETGKTALTGLSATKDVQDSVLADKNLCSLVDIIDIRYWNYRADGTLYAPKGGQHLAPRQHARLVNPGSRSFESVYRAVSEYRRKFPEKAVICSESNDIRFPWAVLMAGGSLPTLPEISDPSFLKAAGEMFPTEISGEGGDAYALGNPEKGLVIWAGPRVTLHPDLNRYKGKLRLFRINPETGKVSLCPETFRGGKVITLKNESDKEIVFWLKME